MITDLYQIGIVLFEQFCEDMLNLHIVVRAGKAEACGAFQRISGHIVQSAYQGF
jgi:hypothetical protein